MRPDVQDYIRERIVVDEQGCWRNREAILTKIRNKYHESKGRAA